MFISFEGVDGSGKSTQAALLSEALGNAGYEVIPVREPGGTVLSEAIRTLLLDPRYDVTPQAELLLFSAARAQLVTEVIQPALTRGAIVIADRFCDSTHAYQGAGRAVASKRFIDDVSTFSTGGTLPHLTFLVDVPVEVSLERRAKGEKADRIEQAGEELQQKVRSAYLICACAEPSRFVVLDGNLDASELHASILHQVLRDLPQITNLARP